ncbi:LuxR family transcriptional regulator, partial [Streptacidiphilus carbonis]|uniref:LuxR family transcriptional regulator n=1 Tax=Streptacidiphilus carbonis TaxID=105422 RepID=UPI0005A92D10
EAAVEAGETDRAAELAARTLRRLAPEGADGRESGADGADRLRRAQLLLVQATTQFWRGSDQGSFDLLLRTADLAADVAPEHLARVLLQAFHVAWYLGEEAVGEVVDRLTALGTPPAAAAHPTAAQAGYLLAAVGSLLGRTEQPPPPVADTVARARAAGAAVPVDLVTVCGATLIMGRDDETVRLAEELVAEARAVGAVGALPTLLFFLAEGELFQGRPGEAVTNAVEALRIAEDTGQLLWAGQLHSFHAHLAALRGDEPSARRSAGAAQAAGLAGRAWTQWSLGLLDLGLGRAEECLARLEQLAHSPQRHHVAGLRAVPDLVEAAVRLREPERAAAPFDYFRRWSARTGQPWTAALVLRCEALLGHDADAEDRFTAALRLHEEQDRPWDRARTALLYGEWLRRGRRKAEARGPLLAAQSVFDELGAVPWAERARSELGATGTAAPQGRAGSGPLASLTPQESQIVRLAAQGMSNRDIAAQLFLSSRTVGYHLYKAYPKLGVASRGELAELL